MADPTPSVLRSLIWVFLAGGLGATVRVTLGEFIDGRLSERLPYIGTLAVNMLGCFAIGVAVELIPAGSARTAIVGGFLGAFTTYSAFALFSFELLREDKLTVLLVQIATHLLLGVLCVWAGIATGRTLGGAGPT